MAFQQPGQGLLGAQLGQLGLGQMGQRRRLRQRIGQRQAGGPQQGAMGGFGGMLQALMQQRQQQPGAPNQLMGQQRQQLGVQNLPPGQALGQRFQRQNMANQGILRRRIRRRKI